MVVPSIASDPLIGRLKRRLARADGVVHVSGLWGSSARLLATVVASPPRVQLYVTPHLEQADTARDDLELFLPRDDRCELFPAWETLPGEGAATSEIGAERVRLCVRLRKASGGERDKEQGAIIVAPIQALMQPVPAPSAIEANTCTLTAGMENDRTIAADPAALLAWLVDRGFERLELVEAPGDVAMRGDIVDVFVPGEQSPFRIEFDGETIESIRQVDISSQRSIEHRKCVTLTAVPSPHRTDAGGSSALWDYLPSDTLILLDEPGEIQSAGEILKSRLGNATALFDARDVLASLSRFPQLHLSSFGAAPAGAEDHFDAGVKSVSRFDGDAAAAVSELCRLARDRTVHVVCDAPGERERLANMIDECPDAGAAVHDSIHWSQGLLHRGFEWTATKTVVVGHHEIFHRHRQRRAVRRIRAGRPLESWLDLNPGDYVVHVVHGIARYQGLKEMRKGDSKQQEEFLCLEFADRARVYVPCSQINLVQKYIGAGGRKPELSKLGGKRWGKTKQKVVEAVAQLAEDLLRVQAQRQQAVGRAYPADTEWQREFEAAFPYEETEDQTVVAAEIRDDLMRTRPMDRLVCGDVGYGKTELAMRAAFKVAEYGAQVAVLVPTTVLCEQHDITFRERMAEYPFAIACLSRFRSPSEQRRIVEGLKKGRIDIVIGTHRLLSKDIAFANLGLIIIDEEQRFGVEHKERLKALRESVDVLTLTATPIPRTLHMSLMGLRDISSLQTPPVDRRAIATLVRPFRPELIREGITRELNRNGQVYFVHNFVHSIAAVAERIQKIVPEARVGFAHGQMRDDELEAVMTRFLRRKLDVLVSTTIIESGIDIPSVNTIFIDRAERFGLADLHQLRGRVGRSSHRAYCHLLVPPDRPPTPKAGRRLKTIEEFSELGAGFRIAMRDLEIRGAGNLLGREQSGHIAAVGYEMYCQLLERTVRRLKSEPDPTPPPIPVDLDVTAHIPRHYIKADRLRMEVYRRIVACASESDLQAIALDLADAFGPVPAVARRLLDVAEIRVRARRFGVLSISLRRPDVVFSVDQMSTAEPLFVDAPGTVRMPDSRTIHLRPPPDRLAVDALLKMLREMFVRASAAVEMAS